MVPRSCCRPLPEDTTSSKLAKEAPRQHLWIPQWAIRRTFHKGESRCSPAVSQRTQGRQPHAGSVSAVPPGVQTVRDCAHCPGPEPPSGRNHPGPLTSRALLCPTQLVQHFL